MWSLFIGFNLHFPNDSSLITYNVDLEIEENTRLSEIYLCDFKVGKNSFDRAQKMLTIKEKIYIYIYIYDIVKIKTLEKMDKQAILWNKYIQRTYSI